MYTTPIISVLLPSYNHQQWIAETIKSILNQSIANIELIIVDDASTDDSVNIIKKYAAKDQRIKYKVFSDNSGAMVALNTCYELCSGKYIATISSDDIWELDKLEKQLKILESDINIGAIFALAAFIDENGNTISNVNDGFKSSIKQRTKYEWMNHFLTNNCICYPTSLVRRECYEEVGFFNTTYRSLPDLQMWVRLFYYYDVFIIDEPLMCFRIHSYNESGRNIANIVRCQTEHKQILKIMLEQIGSLDELKKIFPKHSEIFKIDNELLLSYYFALILLSQKKSFYHDLAFDILFEELSKKEIIAIVNQNNLYDSVDLSIQIAQSDIYRINNDFVKKKVFIKFFGLNILERIKTNSHKTLCFLGIPVFRKKIKVY